MLQFFLGLAVGLLGSLLFLIILGAVLKKKEGE